MLSRTEFRLSTYLALAIACGCLGYAESELFSEVGIFAGIAIVALAVIYQLETRVTLLSIPEANRVGGGIAFATAIWATIRTFNELQTHSHQSLGWPLFFVTLMAPLLMAAICAMLLRREKHAGDYWMLHAAGLAAMVLAAAMVETPILALLAAAYASCAVWSLFQLFLASANGSVPLAPAKKTGSLETVQIIPASAPASQTVRHGLLRSLVWSGLAAATALPFYLATPRSTFGKLEIGKPRIEIGYAADQMVDLNRVGELGKNSEVAFEVIATDRHGKPKLDLSPHQRWRGTVLFNYSRGSWSPDSSVFVTSPDTSLEEWRPPDLGDSAYHLDFTVPSKLGWFLADPVMWAPGQPVPVADLSPDGTQRPWVTSGTSMTFVNTSRPEAEKAELRYRQYTRAATDENLSPRFVGGLLPPLSLTTMNLGGVKDFADHVLSELVEAGKLPSAVLERNQVTLRRKAIHHEAIARAFRDHLSTRPDLSYTTNLKRMNKSVDPIEDFLFHSKAGHCERFATALVLMLRAEGIPAALVLGFKGCENAGSGRYIVRQEHAHAWADALITRLDERNRPVRYWLSLDPEPLRESRAADAGTEASWLDNVQSLFERFFIHYTPGEREQAIRAVVRFATRTEVITGATILVLLCGLVQISRARSRRATKGKRAVLEAEWYARLLAILDEHGIRPEHDDTAREFAESAGAALAANPATAKVAHIARKCVDTYYLNRFGGVKIPDELRFELERDLETLKKAITQNAPVRGRKRD